MRLAVPLLVLFCAVQVGSKGGWSGGGRTGGSSFGGGGKSWGGGSGYRPSYGGSGTRWSGGGSTYRNNYGGSGYAGSGVRYQAPRTYTGYGVRPSYAHGSVHGWGYHYAPVYWHGHYTPLVISPFAHTHYYGCPGCYYYGCATCYYRFHHNGYSYDYYSSKEYLPQKSDVKCSRATSDLKEEDKAKLTNSTDATTPTEMAWACPSKSVCCGWECCKEPEEESGISTVGWVFIGIGIFIGVCLLICCIWWIIRCCCCDRRDAVYYNTQTAATAEAAENRPPGYNSVITPPMCGPGYGPRYGPGYGGVVAYPSEPVF